MSSRTPRLLLALTTSALLVALGAPAAHAAADGGGGGDDTNPVDFLHNVTGAAAPVTGAALGQGAATKPGVPICTTSGSPTANVNTDCDGQNPHNETAIAVNPTNANNLIGGANDYQLRSNPGGHVAESVLSRAHVTFDGGRTWSEYPINANSAYQATGDPSIAFDATGHAYYATLGFGFTGAKGATNPDIVVANSGDGGRNWTSVRVASGSGNSGSVGDLLDKEWIAAWGAGNAIVSFGDFRQAQKGAIVTARIHTTVTHDYGRTWSAPVVVSGPLDQAFVSVPTVTKDGRVFVAFLNTVASDNYRDDYVVSEVSPATGALVAGPFTVARTIDGATDYPIAFGRQTYQDSLFRSWAAGNITSDPTHPGHLAVVWSDMRNSVTPAPADPYAARTNSDVVVSQSSDYGRHWSAPTALARANDQFMPWGAYDASGRLRIGAFDRSYDSANHLYGYSVSTETTAGSLRFTTTLVSTALSDPTKNDRWFAATANAAFPYATTFLGDYSNIAVTPSGVAAYWTDMRTSATFGGRTGHGEDAYFGVTR
ncbi:sialidase family protein [Amnibacterium sp. CER49]|uniref:sialidase family protein n=1 Tax=Amnibacterium sp. CER49 TaxID=3039161 RepID=UPI00244B849F|nr:sialidase family protein [Amnibacterium sp. CER49]MDH2444590.1 sialidase family protein [Amnibacterium sp. CER49]